MSNGAYAICEPYVGHEIRPPFPERGEAFKWRKIINRRGGGDNSQNLGMEEVVYIARLRNKKEAELEELLVDRG